MSQLCDRLESPNVLPQNRVTTTCPSYINPRFSAMLSTLSTLPTEILIAIFTELDYLTLTLSVSHTCRRFHEILTAWTSPSSPNPLSQSLTRYHLTTSETQSESYALHPVFQQLLLGGSTNTRITTSNIGVGNSSSNFTPIEKSSVGGDNATFPPCNFFYIKVRNWGKYTLRKFIDTRASKSPITVVQVADAVRACLAPGPEDRMGLCECHKTRLPSLNLLLGGMKGSIEGEEAERKEGRRGLFEEVSADTPDDLVDEEGKMVRICKVVFKMRSVDEVEDVDETYESS